MRRGVFGADEPAPGDAGGQSPSILQRKLRTAWRRPFALFIRLACILIAGILVWFQFHSGAPGRASDNGAGPMLLKVGDCFQLPTGTTLTSVPPIPCGGPHDAQLYVLYTTADLGLTGGFECDSGVLKTGPAPAEVIGYSFYTFEERDGSTVSACVLDTSPTADSAVP